jgi:hypothetical protein
MRIADCIFPLPSGIFRANRNNFLQFWFQSGRDKLHLGRLRCTKLCYLLYCWSWRCPLRQIRLKMARTTTRSFRLTGSCCQRIRGPTRGALCRLPVMRGWLFMPNQQIVSRSKLTSPRSEDMKMRELPTSAKSRLGSSSLATMAIGSFTAKQCSRVVARCGIT